MVYLGDRGLTRGEADLLEDGHEGLAKGVPLRLVTDLRLVDTPGAGAIACVAEDWDNGGPHQLVIVRDQDHGSSPGGCACFLCAIVSLPCMLTPLALLLPAYSASGTLPSSWLNGGSGVDTATYRPGGRGRVGFQRGPPCPPSCSRSDGPPGRGPVCRGPCGTARARRPLGLRATPGSVCSAACSTAVCPITNRHNLRRRRNDNDQPPHPMGALPNSVVVARHLTLTNQTATLVPAVQ